MVDAAGVRKQAKEAPAQAQQQAAAAAAEDGDKSPAASGAKAASDLFYKGWVSYVEAPSHAAALLQQLLNSCTSCLKPARQRPLPRPGSSCCWRVSQAVLSQQWWLWQHPATLW